MPTLHLNLTSNFISPPLENKDLDCIIRIFTFLPFAPSFWDSPEILLTPKSQLIGKGNVVLTLSPLAVTGKAPLWLEVMSAKTRVLREGSEEPRGGSPFLH